MAARGRALSARFIVIAIERFILENVRLRVESARAVAVYSESAIPSKSRITATPERRMIAATNRVCSFYEHHTAQSDHGNRRQRGRASMVGTRNAPLIIW